MSLAPQRNTKTVSEVRNVAVSFSGKLDSGELLTGTPVITESTSPQALTFSSIAISTTALTINDISTPIGEAIQFSVTGGAANAVYTIKIVCGTDSTPAQTLYGTLTLRVRDDT